MNVLDLRDLADEWQEILDEMGANVPNTEGMSWGEVADATDAFLRAPEQAANVAKYVALCSELGLDPAEPDTLRWHADRVEATLIPESDFEDYARELAEDTGAISRDGGWPHSCIDWERAARELAMDYTTVEYDGDTYYTRS